MSIPGLTSGRRTCHENATQLTVYKSNILFWLTWIATSKQVIVDCRQTLCDSCLGNDSTVTPCPVQFIPKYKFRFIQDIFRRLLNINNVNFLFIFLHRITSVQKLKEKNKRVPTFSKVILTIRTLESFRLRFQTCCLGRKCLPFWNGLSLSGVGVIPGLFLAHNSSLVSLLSDRCIKSAPSCSFLIVSWAPFRVPPAPTYQFEFILHLQAT